jgi:hypothetical protein
VLAGLLPRELLPVMDAISQPSWLISKIDWQVSDEFPRVTGNNL